MNKLSTETLARLLPVAQEIEPEIDRIIDGAIRKDGSIVCVVAIDDEEIGVEIRDGQIETKLLSDEEIEMSAYELGNDDDPIDPILAQLKPIGDATFAEWFVTLQSLMQESENLVEFREKLTDVYPDLDAAEFKQAMLDASVVAGMKGYDDAASIDRETEFKAFGDECLDMLVASLFDRYTHPHPLMLTIEPIHYPLLISIIDASYTDGLDRISSARLNDDDTILMVGMDGYKQIGAKISDSNIKIRILNPDPIDTDSADFSESNIYQQLGMRLVELALEAEFAAPKSKSNGSLKKKSCKTGLSCGGSCISKLKVCARALSIDQQKQFKELKKRLKSGDSEAQKGIDDLRDEQQGKTRSKSQETSKSEVKDTSASQLATTPKKAEPEQPKRPLSEREQIDNKYAKPKVSDEDADAWLKERAKVDSNPEEAESIAIAMALKPKGYSKAVNSRESYVEMLKTIDPLVTSQEAEEMLQSKTAFWKKRMEDHQATDIASEGKAKPSKAKKLADAERMDIVRRRMMADLPPAEAEKLESTKIQELAKDYLQKVATGTVTAAQRFGLNSDASVADIKKRYRELATKNHPDVGGSAEKFMQIQSDYQQLLSKQSSQFTAFSANSLIDLLTQLNLEIED